MRKEIEVVRLSETVNEEVAGQIFSVTYVKSFSLTEFSIVERVRRNGQLIHSGSYGIKSEVGRRRLAEYLIEQDKRQHA